MIGLMIARRVARGAAGTTRTALATRARKITVVILAVVALAIGAHLCGTGNNSEIARNEKQIHQEYKREAAQYAKAADKIHVSNAPTCTTTVKSGTHTVHVDAKGRVSHSTTSGTTTKTCK